MEFDFDRDIEQDVKINRFKLDEECEKQSEIYRYWSKELAQAKSEMDFTWTRLKMEKAGKNLYYRNHPKDGMKATESSVAAMVDVDEKVIECRNNRTKAQEKLDILSGVIASLENKRSQLKNLTELHINGYYSSPTGSRPSSTDSVDEEIQQSLNKKEEKDNE